MKTVAMVPIKLNNQRAPGKNTKKFDDGKPLIMVFLETLIKVHGLNQIYVFCSDSKIKQYMLPGVTFLERPKFLDTADATPQDIISEFMKLVDADIYAVCHCTSPFVKAEHIEACIDAVKSKKYDSAFTAEKIQKLLWTADHKPMNFEADHVPRTQDLKPIYSELSAAYVFTKDLFLRTHRRVGYHPYIMEVNGPECVDIDYPEDFEIANAIYMQMILGNRGIK